ncbi:hypothetical protein [Spiroplasma endosymbiont of Notiophilus biguttatus]|uniref:hypothetical protein n=1 Tax=Spiroplasma endosymbiont of Notiophilus biguttatus TaxID=3066285 RepID=UPI00313AD36C
MKKEISLLSGGQIQRFNCFLSILNDPEILILDELVTGLDLKMQIKLVNFIKSWKEIKKINLLTDFSPHVLVEGTMKLNEFNNVFQTEQQCLAYIAGRINLIDRFRNNKERYNYRSFFVKRLKLNKTVVEV